MISPVKMWRDQKELVGLPGKIGKIISWTIIRVPPGDILVAAPYPVVLVSFENEQKSRMCQLVDWKEADLQMGQMVRFVVRRFTDNNKEGVISYVIKAQPVVW